MKAIIPVAGFGTRFLPATKTQAKEMLPLIDIPVIQYIVEEIVDSGVTDIVFVTSKHKKSLEDYFDSHNELEIALKKKGKDDELKELERIESLAQFTYVRQKRALGNADAVMAAAHIFEKDPIVVAFGDDVFLTPEPVTEHLLSIHKKYNAPTCVLKRVPKENTSMYGIVQTEGVGDGVYRITDIVEKPTVEDAPSNLAVFGRYVITPEVIACVEDLYPPKPGKEVGISDALKLHLENGGEFYGYEIEPEHHFDCGSKTNFIKATIHLALQREEFKHEIREYLRSLEL